MASETLIFLSPLVLISAFETKFALNEESGILTSYALIINGIIINMASKMFFMRFVVVYSLDRSASCSNR